MKAFVPKNTTPVQAIQLKADLPRGTAGDYLLVQGDNVSLCDAADFEAQYAPQHGQAAHKDSAKRRRAVRDPVDQRLSVYRAMGREGHLLGITEADIRCNIPKELANTHRRLHTTLKAMVEEDKLTHVVTRTADEPALYLITAHGMSHRAILEENDARRVKRTGMEGAR